MKLKNLNTFIEIAQAGSLSKAAGSLGIAQPALSQLVANLEHQLGATLFHRRTTGMELTPAGEMFLKYAKKISSDLEQARLDVKHASQVPAGEVSVVIAAAIANLLAPELMMRAEALFPDVKITVRRAMSYPAAQLIREGQVDVGIVPGAKSMSNVKAELAYIDEMIFAGGIGTPLDQPGPISFAEACRAPLVLPSQGHLTHRTIDQVAFDRGLHLNLRTRQDSSSLLRKLLACGYAYTIMPRAGMLEGVREGKLFIRQIPDLPLTRQMFVITSTDRPNSAAVRAVRTLLWQQLERLSAEGIVPSLVPREPSPNDYPIPGATGMGPAKETWIRQSPSG
ncbi:MAG: hypothetical protein CMH13_23030 [Martelella sp.]|uniref:LysR family transcriptional regulator n=1 Tax=unclassified Martelella TaxID=2629616 RepID=UPI000C695465|nr:LysR family transcriptional regulator [Martelella sp.]MAU23375.1 hypothetical protein [Martelella sp.]